MGMVAEARGPFGDRSNARQLHPAHFAVRIGRLALVVASPIASEALLAAAESGLPGADIGHTGPQHKSRGKAGWAGEEKKKE